MTEGLVTLRMTHRAPDGVVDFLDYQAGKLEHLQFTGPGSTCEISPKLAAGFQRAHPDWFEEVVPGQTVAERRRTKVETQAPVAKAATKRTKVAPDFARAPQSPAPDGDCFIKRPKAKAVTDDGTPDNDERDRLAAASGGPDECVPG
jgi:hypothetical protein